MGPEIMLAATLASSAIGAIGQAGAAKAAGARMESEAQAGVQAAQIEAQWAKRRQDEEMAGAQHNASERLREARLTQSKLIAGAAAGGGNASDPTVMDIWRDIEGTGYTNAAREQVEGQRKADAIKYQSDMNIWKADNNSKLASYSAGQARSGATMSMIGGMLGAIGQAGTGYYNSKMQARYGGYAPQSGRGTGYGE
ncbi:MAG: hypothetical protein IT533_10005 [Hyphomicrobiales bacterium]|nr:hypothetical protein [Hyphomicrobiales bacterium]